MSAIVQIFLISEAPICPPTPTKVFISVNIGCAYDTQISSDIDCRFQSQRHLYPSFAFQLGVFRVFPVIKITVIRQVRMFCGLNVKVNTCETPHNRRRSWTHFVYISFGVCGRQKPKYPQLQLHG